MNTRHDISNTHQTDASNLSTLPTAKASTLMQQPASQASRVSKGALPLFSVRAVLLALLLVCGLSSTTAFAGPVIVGGDDLDFHGNYNNGSGPNKLGWLYMQRALANMYGPGCITRAGNDGSIAVLGTTFSNNPNGVSNSNALVGSAIHFAGAVALGKTVNYYDGVTAINNFFAALNAGTVNPAIIYIPSSTFVAPIDGIDANEANQLTANAAVLKNFVNSGGGLMAHIVNVTTSGWLTTVLPGLVINFTSCTATGATLTAAGNTAFPGLTNADIAAGPCHATFSGNLNGLSVLAQDGGNPKRNLIIGGGCGTNIGGSCSPSFTSTTVCQGQATAFTNTAACATSWNWTFGDSASSTLNSSTLQNPTHAYAVAGTYTVKLCINGSTTNCVQNTVTVKALPPAPVIIGPTNTCNGMSANYAVQPVSGVTYTWSIGNGSPAGAIGTSVNITWNAPGGGNITVTATGANGCTSTTRLLVSNCNTYLGACCDLMKINADAPKPVHQGQNIYLFTPALSVTPPTNIIRVTATIISASRTTAATCGTSGPVSSYVTSASPVAGFIPTIPVTFGSEVIWHSLSGGGVFMSGFVNFPFNIQFPPQQNSWKCSDTVSFCVKYQMTDKNCRTCEIIRCYSFVRKALINWENDDDINHISIGKAFSTAIMIVDDNGKPVEEAVGKATISIKPGTGERGARLSGQTTAEVVNGRAVFRDLSIDRPGKGYVLVVNIPEIAEPLESKPFDVSSEKRER